MVARQPSFLKANYILEVGSGNFSRLFALARRFPEKEFFGIDFYYSAAAQKQVQANYEIKNAHIIKLDAKREIFATNLFDFAFSIAVGEHIAELGVFLTEMSRIIRANCIYYFIQAPFWTSYKGHHYNHGDEKICRALGNYCHLRYTPDQMNDHLLKIGWPTEKVADCIHRVYYRGDLSRLSPTETKFIIGSSKFLIEFWHDIEDENFNFAAAQEIISDSDNFYTLYDLQTKGAEVSLINSKDREKT